MTTLITIRQTASKLALSPATIYRMIQASEYKAKGIDPATVPAAIRGYMDLGFPLATKVTARKTRLSLEAINAWLLEMASK